MILSRERLLAVGISTEEIESFGYMHFNTGDDTTEDELSDEEILEMIAFVKKLKNKTTRSK